MSRVLITGGAGFIGTHLAQALNAAGYKVHVLDTLSPQVHGPKADLPEILRTLPGISFQRGSVTDRAALIQALDGVETVIHLAAETGTGQSMYEIARYTSTNVQGTAELMDILATEPGHRVRRILLASSRSIYGEGAYIRPSDGVRMTPESRKAEALKARQWEPVCPTTGEALELAATHEDDRAAPASVYAATKLAQEDLVRISCDSLGIGHAILRLQNVYGEGQSLANPYTGILSIFSTRIRRGLDLPIFEDGQESRDFVHVSDVTAAFVAATRAEQPANATMNIGAGRNTSVLEVADALSRAFGMEPNLRITGEFRLGDIRHNYADTSRARDILGHRPGVDLAEGLARFAAWVSDQPLPADRLDSANAELKSRNMMGQAPR